ncbi:MAG TPA: hypothetical protein VF181_05845 [Balneolaceae bacterium]
MKTIIARNFVLLLSLIFIGVACDNSSDSDNGDAATIQGRVENTSSSDTTNTDTTQARFKTVEDAAVVVTRVQSNGSLEVISDSAVTTNAEGEFSLRVDADAISGASDQLVVQAEKEGETAKAFVTPQVETGTTVLVQPITFESSAEANVYQQLIAGGNAESVEKADIEAYVITEVALDIESDSALAANLASALVARAAANTEFYTTLGVEVSEEQRDEIRRIKLDAQTELENRLYASAGEEGNVAAFDDFIETIARVDMDAGVNATAAAKASKGSSIVLLNQSAAFSADAQAELRQRTALMFTFPLSEAVQEQLDFAGASEDAINSAADAAVTLRTNIRSMNNPSEEELNATFAAYNEAVVNIVQNEFDTNGQLFAVANATINENGGARSSLEATLQGVVTVPEVIDAYTQFYGEVESVVDDTFQSAVDAELSTYFTELLILINLAS